MSFLLYKTLCGRNILYTSVHTNDTSFCTNCVVYCVTQILPEIMLPEHPTKDTSRATPIITQPSITQLVEFPKWVGGAYLIWL